MRVYFFIAILSIGMYSVQGQIDSSGLAVPVIIVDGEAMPYVELEEVEFVSDEYYKLYKRKKYYVLKVYAYALYVKERLDSLENGIEELDKKRQKRKFIKSEKKEVMDMFAETVKNMSTSQGRMLVKLVHRETNQTIYNLIKKFQSGMKAQMWQSAGRAWGVSLKETYKPEVEDKITETVIQDIKSGKIKFKNEVVILEKPTKAEKKEKKEKKKLARKTKKRRKRSNS